MEDDDHLQAQAPTSYRAHGKLLLSGEYAVLDGALALALPTRYGQTLIHYPPDNKASNEQLRWEARDPEQHIWFSATFQIPGLELLDNAPSGMALRLQTLLREALRLRPDFGTHFMGKTISSLEFSRHWGLGSSSTLVSLIAQWSGADPFALHEAVWPGGSGYDLACADAHGPIFYRLSGKLPTWEHIDFHPAFSGKLHFVHQGHKQNTREAIGQYRRLDAATREHLVLEISDISEALRRSKSLTTFEHLLQEHERLLGVALKQTPVQQARFSNFQGVVKSLGAWGGDFMLATGEPEYVLAYFQDQGLREIRSYHEMVLSSQAAPLAGAE